MCSSFSGFTDDDVRAAEQSVHDPSSSFSNEDTVEEPELIQVSRHSHSQESVSNSRSFRCSVTKSCRVADSMRMDTKHWESYSRRRYGYQLEYKHFFPLVPKGSALFSSSLIVPFPITNKLDRALKQRSVKINFIPSSIRVLVDDNCRIASLTVSETIRFSWWIFRMIHLRSIDRMHSRQMSTAVSNELYFRIGCFDVLETSWNTNCVQIRR